MVEFLENQRHMAILTGRLGERGLNGRLIQFTIPESNRLVPGVALFYCLPAIIMFAVRFVRLSEAGFLLK